MRAARSPDRTQTTHRRSDRTYINTVVVRTKPQTERATDSAIRTQGGMLSAAHRGEQNATVDALPAGDRRALQQRCDDSRQARLVLSSQRCTQDRRGRRRLLSVVKEIETAIALADNADT